MEIHIVNWFKHNTRKDVKNPSWFKLSYRMLEDPEFDSLTGDEFKAWIYLLSCACRKQSDNIHVNFEHARRVSNIQQETILSCIDKLARYGHVTCPSRERYANDTLDKKRIEEKREEERGALVKHETPDQMGFLEPTHKPLSDAQRFIAAYVGAYQETYPGHTRPSLVGKVQGQIKQFLKDIPIDRACAMIQVYMQMDDPWFKTKCHDFGTFIENLTKVGLALDTGEKPGAPKKTNIEDILAGKDQHEHSNLQLPDGSTQGGLRGKVIPRREN